MLIKRSVLPKITHWLEKEKILILKGARQVGKTTILKQMISGLEKDRIHFYRTVSGAEVDFVLEDKESKVIAAEVKYRPKINVPVAMKNFSRRYPNLISQKIIFTKDTLKKDSDGTVFLPVNLLPFTDILA